MMIHTIVLWGSMVFFCLVHFTEFCANNMKDNMNCIRNVPGKKRIRFFVFRVNFLLFLPRERSPPSNLKF